MVFFSNSLDINNEAMFNNTINIINSINHTITSISVNNPNIPK